MPTVKPAPVIPSRVIVYDRHALIDGIPRTTFVHRVDAWEMLEQAHFSLVPDGGRYADLDPTVREMFAKHPVVGPAMKREAELGDGAAPNASPKPNVAATASEVRGGTGEGNAPLAPATAPSSPRATRRAAGNGTTT